MAARTRTTGKQQRDPKPRAAIDWNGPIMTVDEAVDRYPGQWMLMLLLGDPFREPRAGRLLAHGTSHQQISALAIEAARTRPRPDGVCTMFDGYHLIRTGEGLRRVLEELYEKVVAGEIAEEELDKHFDLHTN
jgi:hypothetical protein